MIFRNKILGLLTLLAIIAAVCGWYFNRGYGQTGEQAYAYSMAIFSALNQHDVEKLDSIIAMIKNDRQSGQLGSDEARWLEQIIANALRGNWKSANQEIRRLMHDQVRYAPSY